MSRWRRSTARCSKPATDLGDGRWRRFWRVTLPLSAPGTIGAALLVFIPTVGDYVTPTLVGGPGGTMIGNTIQALFGQHNDGPLGAALSIVMMLIVTLLVCLFLWLDRLPPHAGADSVKGHAPDAHAARHLCRRLPDLPLRAGPAAAGLLFQRQHLRDLSAEGLHAAPLRRQWPSEMRAAGRALRNSVIVGIVVSVLSTALGLLGGDGA